MKRWTEHFTDLFYNPSVINENVINNLPQKDIILEMMDHPSIEEIQKTIKQINTGKAPGFDGIPIEVLLHGGDKLAAEVHRLISDVWLGAPVPQDWIDAILISLYKGKGLKSVCGDYRGISLKQFVKFLRSSYLIGLLSGYVPLLSQKAKVVLDLVVVRST